MWFLGLCRPVKTSHQDTAYMCVKGGAGLSGHVSWVTVLFCISDTFLPFCYLNWVLWERRCYSLLLHHLCVCLCWGLVTTQSLSGSFVFSFCRQAAFVVVIIEVSKPVSNHFSAFVRTCYLFCPEPVKCLLTVTQSTCVQQQFICETFTSINSCRRTLICVSAE